jgi:hypothetical protein
MCIGFGQGIFIVYFVFYAIYVLLIYIYLTTEIILINKNLSISLSVFHLLIIYLEDLARAQILLRR